MISLEQIREESRKASQKAARAKKQPLTVYEEDLADIETFITTLRPMPFLGDAYVPKGWKVVDVRTVLPDYPYDWFFVDASGLGREGEPALTIDQLRRCLRQVCQQNGYKYGVGLTEVGEYQVHVGLYEAQ